MDLRQAVLDHVHSHSRGDSVPLLSDLMKDNDVSQARKALLPAEVQFRMWIDRRIGGEVEISKDDRGRSIIGLRKSETDRTREQLERTREQKEAQAEAFFASLPAGSFSPAEERLREALLSFLADWKGEDPPTLSHAGGDAAVRNGRIQLLKDVQVSLKEWIDRRVGGEIEMVLEPSGQWAIGLRGRLDHSAIQRNARRRKMEKESISVVTDGKGRGKQSRPLLGADQGHAPPWKARRTEDRPSAGGNWRGQR